MNDFWKVDIANLVTWILIIIVFIASQYTLVKILGARMDNMEDWRKDHEMESRERDKVIGRLEIATEKLTVLSEVAHRRLEHIEAMR